MTLKEKLMCEVYDAYNEHDKTMAPWGEVIRRYKQAMAIKTAADAKLKKKLEAAHKQYERNLKKEEKRSKKLAGTYEDTDDFDSDGTD